MENCDSHKIGAARGGRRCADAVVRLASSYKANRELLEPLARLSVDVLAIVMALRRPSARRWIGAGEPAQGTGQVPRNKGSKETTP